MRAEFINLNEKFLKTLTYNSVKKEPEQNSIVTLYICEVCDNDFDEIEKLKNHKKDEHSEKAKDTVDVSVETDFVENDSDKLAKNDTNQKIDTSNESFKCDICDVVEASKLELRLHRLENHHSFPPQKQEQVKNSQIF